MFITHTHTHTQGQVKSRNSGDWVNIKSQLLECILKLPATNREENVISAGQRV